MSKKLLVAGYRLLVLVLLIGLVACGDETPLTPTIAPTPTPTPAEILSQAGDVMAGLESAGISITRDGGAVYLDANNTLVFNEATGFFAAPDAFQATIKVSTVGIALEVAAIFIDGKQYLTNPLSGAWEELPLDIGLNPAALFDPDTGWQTVLRDHTQNVTRVGLETIGETELLHLTGMVDAAAAEVFSAGISGGSDLPVDFYLDPNTLHIRQLSFTSPSAAEMPAEWVLKFSDFNADVNIQSPIE
jgi:hypothetical protein